ncbi:MAG: chromatin protein Cren7 [Sulfolobus sp.]|jgi:hypothetical protein|nr:chromatin protein Cren7 [Sulfolobus sp.]
MPRKKQQDPYVCPKCGTRVEKPEKTWQLISPIPDAQGRITITIMGSFSCPNGHKWKAVVSKIRAGGSGVEVEGKKGVKKIASEEGENERDRGEVIELDLSDLDKEDFEDEED